MQWIRFRAPAPALQLTTGVNCNRGLGNQGAGMYAVRISVQYLADARPPAWWGALDGPVATSAPIAGCGLLRSGYWSGRDQFGRAAGDSCCSHRLGHATGCPERLANGPRASQRWAWGHVAPEATTASPPSPAGDSATKASIQSATGPRFAARSPQLGSIQCIGKTGELGTVVSGLPAVG